MPTSLTYIVLSTRGCSPWRPAADMGTVRRENHDVRLGFSRADRGAPDTARAAVLYGMITSSLSPGKPIPGSQSLTKKRQLFPGPLPTSPSRFASPHETPKGRSPHPGSGMLTRFPFGRRRAVFRSLKQRPSFRTDLSYPLGPTDPCSTAVHMEPFSTSALKILTRVFATTTKICTSGGSGRARARHLPRTPLRPPYSLGPRCNHPAKRVEPLPQRPSVGSTLERHPFSGLVASAGELLHTPWRIPTSMATVLLSIATNAFHGV